MSEVNIAATPSATPVATPEPKPKPHRLTTLRWPLVATAGVLLLACLAPFQLVPFHTFQLAMAMIYAVTLLGLNLLVGHTGQISLGHGASSRSAPTPPRSRWSAGTYRISRPSRSPRPSPSFSVSHSASRRCDCAGCTWPWSPWPSRSSWSPCSSGSTDSPAARWDSSSTSRCRPRGPASPRTSGCTSWSWPPPCSARAGRRHAALASRPGTARDARTTRSPPRCSG